MQELDQTTHLDAPGFGKAIRLLQALKVSGQPIRISIEGQNPLLIGDETSYQLLLDLMDRLEVLEDIRLGSQELDEGKGLSLEQAKKHVRKN